jgi:hypothetical protein
MKQWLTILGVLFLIGIVSAGAWYTLSNTTRIDVKIENPISNELTNMTIQGQVINLNEPLALFSNETVNMTNQIRNNSRMNRSGHLIIVITPSVEIESSSARYVSDENGSTILQYPPVVIFPNTQIIAEHIFTLGRVNPNYYVIETMFIE